LLLLVLFLQALALEPVLEPELVLEFFLRQPVHLQHLPLLYHRNHRMLLCLLSGG
jgi:hypothetical protein